MLEQALGAEAADDEPTRDEFLDTYQLGCTRTSSLFPGMHAVLSSFERAGTEVFANDVTAFQQIKEELTTFGRSKI